MGSMLLEMKADEDSNAVSDILEVYAANLQSNVCFLDVAETALSGKAESLEWGRGFLKRLCDRESGQLHANERALEHDA